MDWAKWSRDCVEFMASRSRALVATHGLAGAPYHWDLNSAEMVIGERRFRLVTVGTVSGDSFLWAWANDVIPPAAKAGLERVRQFGSENALRLLAEPYVHGGLAQGKECVAIAGRLLDATGVWIDQTQDGFIFFTLHDEVSRAEGVTDDDV